MTVLLCGSSASTDLTIAAGKRSLPIACVRVALCSANPDHFSGTFCVQSMSAFPSLHLLYYPVQIFNEALIYTQHDSVCHASSVVPDVPLAPIGYNCSNGSFDSLPVARSSLFHTGKACPWERVLWSLISKLETVCPSLFISSTRWHTLASVLTSRQKGIIPPGSLLSGSR